MWGLTVGRQIHFSGTSSASPLWSPEQLVSVIAFSQPQTTCYLVSERKGRSDTILNSKF